MHQNNDKDRENGHIFAPFNYKCNHDSWLSIAILLSIKYFYDDGP